MGTAAYLEIPTSLDVSCLYLLPQKPRFKARLEEPWRWPGSCPVCRCVPMRWGHGHGREAPPIHPVRVASALPLLRKQRDRLP